MCTPPTKSRRSSQPIWRNSRLTKPPFSCLITFSRPASPTCRFVRFLVMPHGIPPFSNQPALVTSFPDDPQARLGLNKCMETLRSMKVIWPSAGRAWELLNGNKVNLHGPSSKICSDHPTERQQHHKRPADTQLSDNAPRSGGGSQGSGFGQVYASGASDMGSYPSLADQSNHSPYYDYSRWLGSTDLLGNTATNNLSTGLLPQQYNAGFVGSVGRGGHSHRHRGTDPSTRYPQPLWTDHAAMGQLDPTFVGILPQQSPQEQHPTAGSQGLVNLVNQTHQDQSMYQLTENYYY